MNLGTIKEVKRHEYRVGLTPSCVKAYTTAGHRVWVQQDAGLGAGYENQEYLDAGAIICDTAEEVLAQATMIVKVKEPQPSEYHLLTDKHILYTYLHLAAEETLTKALLDQGVTGIAYETIETDQNTLPLLRPMSEIAGRLSVQEGARFLERPQGGRGVLLGGVPSVEKGRVAILGGGVVGTNAAKMALGLGAQVTILDVNIDQLGYLDDVFQGRATTLYSNRANIERVLKESDLVIGAVLIHGAKAPRLVSRADLKSMKKGSVVVDVAVDQGGCMETTRPTTHDEPVYVIEDVLHYCVANMPGAVSRTSTQALTTATLPYGLKLASLGIRDAITSHTPLLKGLNTYQGKLTYQAVAEAFDIPYTNPKDMF
jgi:alanine dehydrogenase